MKILRHSIGRTASDGVYRKGYKNAYVNKVMKVFKAMLNKAVE